MIEFEQEFVDNDYASSTQPLKNGTSIIEELIKNIVTEYVSPNNKLIPWFINTYFDILFILSIGIYGNVWYSAAKM